MDLFLPFIRDTCSLEGYVSFLVPKKVIVKTKKGVYVYAKHCTTNDFQKGISRKWVAMLQQYGRKKVIMYV
ncbi:camphor resistance protein B [Bacillus sp. B14905]|nr:camphor resistance protein B [Bacillus sp. B14905]